MCGVSSRSTKRRMDARRSSCSSLKISWRRSAPWPGRSVVEEGIDGKCPRPQASGVVGYRQCSHALLAHRHMQDRRAESEAVRMRQLTGTDAFFLNMETGRFTGHVGGLILIDASETPSGTITADDIRRSIEERMHLLEPFRWRLVEVPLDLDYPYWVESEDFDLEFHVREVALPPPGTREQLAEQVARLTARPLDRSRPLWEFYVIHGLENGLVGLQTKIHHAAVDGASGSEILSVLFDVEPEPNVPPAPERTTAPEPVPTEMELMSRALMKLATQPLEAAMALGRMSSTLATLQPPTTPDGDGGILGSADAQAPRVSFNDKVTAHRRYAF